MNLTILAQLKAQNKDVFGYTNYVFEILDQLTIREQGTKYFVCVRFPNWECRELQIDETGYVELQENIAGKSTWWDGAKFQKYNYDSLQFIKFVVPETNTKVEEIKL